MLNWRTSSYEDGCQDCPKCQEIAAELNKRTIANIEALNERDFSTTSALYHAKAEDWKAEVGHGEKLRELGLNDYVEALIEMTKEAPEFKVELWDVSTTVNAKFDYARTFVNVGVEGFPAGILRHCVVLLVYRWINTDWVACSHKVMGGMCGNLVV